MGNLHPTILALLQKMAENPTPLLRDLTPTQARYYRNPVLEKLAKSTETVANSKEMRVPGPAAEIPIRFYTPEGRAPFPALVYFHGGGFVIGSLDTHDSICRALASKAKCIVVSVDYRLAPDHKYPAAIEDGFAAVKWAADDSKHLQIDPNRIAVGGDSAGATLATVVSLMARDKGAPALVFQLLVYPITNFSSFDTDSYRIHAEKYILRKSSMEWFRDHYLRTPENRKDPLASPLLASNLGGLPPALIMTAEFDILRDEGKAYAERLKHAGVPVRYSCYEGMIHLFWGMAMMNRAENGIEEASAALRSAFEK